jgi:hypothetical protein
VKILIMLLTVILANGSPGQLFAQSPGGEPAGLVVDLQGMVNVIEQGRTTRMEMLSYIRPQTEIEIGPGATLALTWYANSSEHRFKGPARLKVSQDGIQVIQGAPGQERALGEEKVSAARRGVSTRLAQAALTMRSMRAAADITPAAGSRVMTLRPQFRWTLDGGSGSYRFTLRGALGEPLVQMTAKGESLQLSDSIVLEWGKRYRWTVQDARGGSVGEGDFEVITREQVARLGKLRPGANASFSDRVLYAAALDDLGLKAESRELWRKLAAERPDDAALRRFAAR